MKFVRSRLALGKTRYGHGVCAAMDTREFGTTDDSWFEMAVEEFVDGAIYLAADYIRKFEVPNNQGDDNARIEQLLEDPSLMVLSRKHRDMIETLIQCVNGGNKKQYRVFH